MPNSLDAGRPRQVLMAVLSKMKSDQAQGFSPARVYSFRFLATTFLILLIAMPSTQAQDTVGPTTNVTAAPNTLPPAIGAPTTNAPATALPTTKATVTQAQASGPSADGRTVVRVRYGYFPEARPNNAACARGWFDLDVPETNTMYQVTCYPQTSGNFAASRLDNLQLDIANLGSTPWAQAAARGVDAKVVYISHYMGDSQGIYVRADESNYTGIVTPYDLDGRTVGVPFGSTVHYQILFLIDLLGLTGSVKLLNMAPTEIIAAWDDPERNPPIIDAAGCWGVARDHLLRGGGDNQLPARTLASSKLLSDWGRPTYVVTAATRTFSKAHPEFMAHFVGILSRINDSYLDRIGQKDPANIRRWDVQEPTGLSYVYSMVDAMMLRDEKPSSPSNEQVYFERLALDAYLQQSASEQLSCQLLGSEPGQCKSPTLQHLATHQTAKFLLQQKVLARLGPLDPLGNENGTDCQDSMTFCGGDMIDGQYLSMARRTCQDCLPVGPYAAYTPSVGSTENDPDELLLQLEELDTQFSRSAYALSEIGRTGGDSNCRFLETIKSGEIQGTFGDGANAERGRSYSDNLNCRWEVRGADCGSPADPCQSIVELKFERLRVWSGDVVRVYTDPEFTCQSGSRVLLAQLSGIYDEDDQLPPSIRAVGCISVAFETDPNQERTYGDDYGDGFLVSYDRDSRGCKDKNDCNGQPCVRGLCECGGQRWGADCSETRACIGTTHVSLEEGKPSVLSSSANRAPFFFQAESLSHTRALNPAEAYPNDQDCTFTVLVPTGYNFVSVEIYYDLEPTYDLLSLQKGSDTSTGGAEPYAVLTGVHNTTSKPEIYFVPTKNSSASLRLTTDARGRRRGFHATVQAIREDNTFLKLDDCKIPGQSGYACEFHHCISQNRLQPTQQRPPSPYVLGRIVSQTSDWPVPGRGSVPAMPWTEDGCAWPLLPSGLPDGTDNVVALRLVFNWPLDLEPHPITAVGDKLIIRKLLRQTEGEPEFEDTELFVEQCDSNEVCSFTWQTGVCGELGGCIVRNTVEVAYSSLDDTTGATPSALLVTDRNDGGHVHSGLDFDVLLVQQCPTEDGETHCKAGGGECVDGFCFCEEGVPCSCPCDGEQPDVISTGVKIGIVVGTIVPIFVLLLVVFLWYRRRKIKKSREQKDEIQAKKDEIQAKEAELEKLRDSVVDMCTATKQFIPAVSEKVETAPPPAALQSGPVEIGDGADCGVIYESLWCWKETEHKMSEHDKANVVGDPADCWVKYDKEAGAQLEAAFREKKGAGECSPLPGYVVDFGRMKQTKEATGFERDVQRLVEKAVLDLTDVHTGDILPEGLVGEPQMVLVAGDLIQISKKRPDGWAFGSKLKHANEELARQLVKVAIGQSSVDDASILTDTGWFELKATRASTSDDLVDLQKTFGNATGGALDPPEFWAPVKDPTVVQQHELAEGDPERTEVVNAFLSTLNMGQVKVVRVERLQNLAMWQSYVVKRQTICYRETQNGVDHERALERFERSWLWHGTNIEVMDKIIQQGFNRSFCGKNATAYGKGVYFARDAAYSSHRLYSVPDRNGTQYMMACRVVVGEYCEGEHDALTPDFRDASKNILYDSTVGLLSSDTMDSPSIYVTYHDAQAYPEYLIAFQTK